MAPSPAHVFILLDSPTFTLGEQKNSHTSYLGPWKIHDMGKSYLEDPTIWEIQETIPFHFSPWAKIHLLSGNLTYLLEIAIYSWITYQKWWFSIAMLVYQRVAGRSIPPWSPLGSPATNRCSSNSAVFWSVPGTVVRKTGRSWSMGHGYGSKSMEYITLYNYIYMCVNIIYMYISKWNYYIWDVQYLKLYLEYIYIYNIQIRLIHYGYRLLFTPKMSWIGGSPSPKMAQGGFASIPGMALYSQVGYLYPIIFQWYSHYKSHSYPVDIPITS